MRVTNLMTSNMMLLNLNKTMTSLNYLQYQSMTGNKIRYASDDPIIAGRSLKFRTNIVETDQYLSNVNQGRSWLQTSANAVKNVFEAMTNSGETSIRSLLVSAGGVNTIDDCKIYSNQLMETLNEIKSELNVSYAGRYVFSGFKTDEKPSFDIDNPGMEMIVNQSFNINDIQTDYRFYSKSNQTAMPEEVSCIRLKLAYDVGISALSGFTCAINQTNSTDPDAYKPAADEINFIEDTGELIFGETVYANMKNDISINEVLANEAVDAALKALQAAEKNNTQAGALDAETAAKTAMEKLEALLNNFSDTALNPDCYDKLTDAYNLASTAYSNAQDVVLAYVDLNANPSSIPLQKALQEARYQAKQAAQYSYDSAVRAGSAATQVDITYTKTGFKTGELNPKVYFECMEPDGSKKYDMRNQSIMYEFGVNNKMAVNSLAKDLLTTDLLNDITDVIKIIDGVTISDLDELIKEFQSGGLSYDDALKRAEAQIEDENKFYTDLLGNYCTKLIGKLDKHTAELSRENTSIGSRLSRLDLIYNRLEEDRVNYEELKSDNDYVDAAEAYIKYQSMLSVYQSALQTGASVIKMSLVNYI